MTHQPGVYVPLRALFLVLYPPFKKIVFYCPSVCPSVRPTVCPSALCFQAVPVYYLTDFLQTLYKS